MPKRNPIRDSGSRLPPRKTSPGSGPRRNTRSRTAVSANSRPAPTPEADSRPVQRMRTRSRSRTPDSPREEEVTRSPTSGRLTTSPAFSPPSSPDRGSSNSGDESAGTSSGSESSRDSIPEHLRPAFVPSLDVDDSEESGSLSSAAYEISSGGGYSDGGQALVDSDEIPLDYDEVVENDEQWQLSVETGKRARAPRQTKT